MSTSPYARCSRRSTRSTLSRAVCSCTTQLNLPAGAVAGEHGGQRARVVGVVLVGLREARTLHPLRRVGDPHPLVVVHLRERVVEGVDRVIGVANLRRCPIPGRDAAGTARASRGRHGSRLRILLSWYAVASAIDTAVAGSPRRTPIAAISVAFSACSVYRSTVRAPARLQPSGSGNGPDPRQKARPTPITTTSTTRTDEAPDRTRRGQLLCRAALSAMPSPGQGRPRPAPSPSCGETGRCWPPERSAALTTLGLESMSLIVTLVLAVT